MPIRGAVVLVCAMAVTVVTAAGCGAGPSEDALPSEASALTASGGTVVYDDALRNGFADWSWTTHSLSERRVVYAGRRSIWLEPDAWRGLYLANPARVDLSKYDGIELWVRGASPGGQKVSLVLEDGSTVAASVDLGSLLPSGAIRSDSWQRAYVSFATLGAATSVVDGFALQDASGGDQPRVYVDSITLTPRTAPDPCADHCGNGVLDCGETGPDCGGTCGACTVTPPPDPCADHCGNGVLDCGEIGPDCGGTCGACTVTPPPAGTPKLRGVSLAGAEFTETHLPGTYGVDYTYPTTAEVDHFVGLGMNVFRLPFRWERLQRQQYAALDATELARIDAFVSYATGKGAHVVLDPHNYARYFGAVIGDGVPAAAFADFWSKLATHFAANPRVVFALMNEPHDMTTELWLDDANAAIAAIRAAGATNLILVPGNAWTGGASWLQSWYGTPNGTAMLGIEDPLDNYAFEVHQYLDGNSSGNDMAYCVSSTIGSERLADFTAWLAQHGARGFLGEFGAGDGSTCLAALDDMLSFIDAHPDQWLGWAYWAAGPWWGNSIGNIEPADGVDKAQTGVLVQHVF